MFALTPMARITMNEIRMPRGNVMIATSAERACSKKSTATAPTINDSSMSLSRSVSIAR